MIIKWIIGLFKTTHQKRSEDILKSFSTINADLQELNNDITKEHLKNSEKIQKLQEKNILLLNTFAKNSNVAGNISKLLGD